MAKSRITCCVSFKFIMCCLAASGPVAHFPVWCPVATQDSPKPFIPRTGRKTGHSGVISHYRSYFSICSERSLLLKVQGYFPGSFKTRLQRHVQLPPVRCIVRDQSLELQSKELLFVVKWRRPLHHQTLHLQRTGHKEHQATAHGSTCEHRHRGEREREKKRGSRDVTRTRTGSVYSEQQSCK